MGGLTLGCMNDPLSRFIVWSLTLFALLLAGAAALGTSQTWALRHRSYGPSTVSKAEVVSVQPQAGAPPVVMVMGPSGSEVKVNGTEDLNQPYPLEGDYIEVVFLRSGSAVIPAAGRRDQTYNATILIAGIWLGWCVVIGGSVLAGRYLRATVRSWRPPQRAVRPGVRSRQPRRD